MDENDVADALYEELDAWRTDHAMAPLNGFKVTRDDTGLELTAPDGKRFRAIIIEVPA